MLVGLSFTVLLEVVREGDGFANLDEPAARWLGANRESWITRSLLVHLRRDRRHRPQEVELLGDHSAE